MADFHRFAPILFRHEGGFVNDPIDPGRATNRGITLATFMRCGKKLLGVEPSLESLRNLTEMQAATIYKTLYWDAIRGDEMPYQHIADIVCDFQVNAGSASSRLLQQVLNELGGGRRLAVDGIVGTRTLAALRAADPARVHLLFQEGRRDYYRRLVARRPPLAKFLRGWLRRVDSFEPMVAGARRA